MQRYRALSLLCLFALALSITSYIALRSAEQTDSRGIDDGFPQPVFGAEELRLGVNASLELFDSATLDARLSELQKRGVKYVRQEFRWSEIESTRGTFDWATSDRIFTAAKKHDIRLLTVLWTTPAWARADSASPQFPATETSPPKNIDDFAQFARAFAMRYDNQTSIVAYQIWDEPNLSAAWGNGLVNPTLYLQMLRAARAAIHDVNPNAIIVLAGLAPTVEQTNVNLAPQTFLLKLYQLGGHQAFDIVAAKPYGFDFPPSDRRVDANVLNFSHVILLREVMVAHDEGHKAIWATQFGWNALPPNWIGKPSIWGKTTEQQQSDYTHESIQRASNEWHWLGAMFIDSLQPIAQKDDPRWGFSLLDSNGRARPVFDAISPLMHSSRPNLFADCKTPQSVARTLRLENLTTALPEVLSSKADCKTSNPHALFSEGWRFDQLGADIPDRPDATVRVTFSGDAFALIVRRGNYRAYTFVSIDGKPANLLPKEARGAYLIMTSPDNAPRIETIPVADNLGGGEHVAEITVDRGWNQWALVGWSVKKEARLQNAAVRMVTLSVGFLSVITLIVFARKAAWAEFLRDVWERLKRRQFTPQAIGAALLVWLASSLVWAQDAATAYRNLGLPANIVLPSVVSGVAFWSPVMIVSLVALVALFVLILLRLDIGLMLVAFFIPFFLLPQRIFERAFSMVELLTLMSFASWCARRLKVESGKLKMPTFNFALSTFHLLDWSILALVVVALLSSLQAGYRTEALRELRTVIVEPALFYLMLRATTFDKRRIVEAFVIGATAVACVGLFNYVRGEHFIAEFGLPRIKSVFNSPNNDALFLARALPFAIGYWLLDNKTRLHSSQYPIPNLYFIATILIALALLLSQSRGALLLGVPALLVTMCLLTGGKWRWLGAAIFALVVLAFVVLLSGATQPFLQSTRFANALDLSRGTGFFRINLWQSAWRMFLDHPLLGVGPDNFLYAYRGFYILPAAWQEPNLSHPHNIALDFATRLGGLGLLVGGGLIFGLAQSIGAGLRDSSTRVFAVACAGFLAEVLAHGIVDHSIFLVDLMFVFMLVAGVSMNGQRINE
jgi:O-antigen ligase